MTKIVKIRLENFKAIDIKEMNFAGASAIITGGNNKGKTSFLRGLQDRIRFSRPQIKVRQGEKEGYGEMTLDDGTRFVWEFDDDKKDKLTMISPEGTKANVTKELGHQFFPPLFDIDKFLQSAPKDQIKQLQKIIGLDFTDVDKRYDEAYKVRYQKNEESERYRVKLSKMLKCDPVKPVDLELLHAKKADIKNRQDHERTRLNNLYAENKKKNDNAIAEWDKAKEQTNKDVAEHNIAVKSKLDALSRGRSAHNILADMGYDGEEVGLWLTKYSRDIPEPKTASNYYPERPQTPDPMPSRDTLDAIEKEIEAIDAEILSATETNQKAQRYSDYVAYIKEVDQAKEEADEANMLVQQIEDERKAMISGAEFPAGITISPDGFAILVDGLPLERDQLSTSKLYTAALRIAAMKLGEVKALHFDCSFLDKNSLREVYEWASAQDLQLLIERPDYDGGDIHYELIEA